MQVKPALTNNENTIIEQIANSQQYSRVVIAHTLDVPVMSHILAISDYGGISFRTATSQFVTMV